MDQLLIGRSEVPSYDSRRLQRGEAIFERDLIIHFQQISRAAALYIRALLGAIKRALEIYRRVDETTKNYPWSVQTTEEKWHPHAEDILMVALTTLKLPIEAWKSARLLRAVPNCRLVLMLAYHVLSPALSVEETGLMAYLQAPPEAGPSIMQVTSGLQNWKCAGRRLVEIGGRLPTATQLHQSFIKILSKHLAANKKVNFVFRQQSSTIPMMNPSPTEISPPTGLQSEKMVLTPPPFSFKTPFCRCTRTLYLGPPSSTD